METIELTSEPKITITMDKDDLKALQDIVMVWWVNDRDRFQEGGIHRELAKSIIDIQLATVNATISYSNGQD